jgi:hypothetical protein
VQYSRTLIHNSRDNYGDCNTEKNNLLIMLHNGRLSEITSVNGKECKARNQKCLFDKLYGETVYRECGLVKQMLETLMLITSK